MNSEPTTKQQRSVLTLRPSRLCQIILIALVIKVIVLGNLAYESLWPDKDSSFSNKAYAAEASGAPAAPLSIQSPLPDAGMKSISPEGRDLALDAQAPQTFNAQENGKALPGIGQKRGIGASEPSAGTDSAASDNLAREALLRKQDELSRKEEELKSLEKEIYAKLEDMQVLENRLQIMMKEAKGATDAKLAHLVDVLSNMKARQAAAVLETLDQRIGVKVLANMRGRQAGEILTFVNPDKAARLAEALSRMQLPLE